MSDFPDNLLRGYANFMQGRYRTERERYAELANSGQKPKILVVACCDSRAAPETVFDQGPGELFVLRNVANLVPPYAPDDAYHGTSAALEFAVQSLRIRDIVVMGHGHCGGIKAALDPTSEPLSPGDFIGSWMGMLAPLIKQMESTDTMTKAQRQTALERSSIRHSINNLLTFPCIRILSERGKLHLHGAWFDISTGELWVMDPENGAFIQPKLNYLD